jgi:hypothetical protein
MNNLPQPQRTQLADPDMALLFLGSWFATLHDAPKHNHAMLNALAWHILGERPKTLLGLAIKACAEKWLSYCQMLVTDGIRRQRLELATRSRFRRRTSRRG